ncbi:hypothetical protein GALMADRAFT_249422 [Galerina marginata CBS 339.88]|uniref:Uncharacterized protein n=1 Tax=Galerina marginata (strain CBS 339.88) TaxID=685588 RepID=A0A067SZ79_GALM3|nr:hypothetical protein GALMADRAFT_249422 [Galerina marginata CBS 339.88]
MVNVGDVWQPGFLDPLLEFFSANLPPPLYSFVTSVLSHSLAAITAVLNLSQSLLSTSGWNAQALLPPILTILAAYLALASIYRTTTWLASVMFWFIKWGMLFGIIMAGAGYFMGTAGGAVGNQGAVSMLAGYLGSLFDNNSKGRPQSQRRTKRRNMRPRTKRPKAWESFELHQEWQYREQNEGQDQNVGMQQLMDIVVGAAGQVFGGNWWNSVKSVVKDSEVPVPEPEATKKSPKSKGSRSR